MKQFEQKQFEQKVRKEKSASNPLEVADILDAIIEVVSQPKGLLKQSSGLVQNVGKNKSQQKLKQFVYNYPSAPSQPPQIKLNVLRQQSNLQLEESGKLAIDEWDNLKKENKDNYKQKLIDSIIEAINDNNDENLKRKCNILLLLLKEEKYQSNNASPNNSQNNNQLKDINIKPLQDLQKKLQEQKKLVEEEWRKKQQVKERQEKYNNEDAKSLSLISKPLAGLSKFFADIFRLVGSVVPGNIFESAAHTLYKNAQKRYYAAGNKDSAQKCYRASEEIKTREENILKSDGVVNKIKKGMRYAIAATAIIPAATLTLIASGFQRCGYVCEEISEKIWKFVKDEWKKNNVLIVLPLAIIAAVSKIISTIFKMIGGVFDLFAKAFVEMGSNFPRNGNKFEGLINKVIDLTNMMGCAVRGGGKSKEQVKIKSFSAIEEDGHDLENLIFNIANKAQFTIESKKNQKENSRNNDVILSKDGSVTLPNISIKNYDGLESDITIKVKSGGSEISWCNKIGDEVKIEEGDKKKIIELLKEKYKDILEGKIVDNKKAKTDSIKDIMSLGGEGLKKQLENLAKSDKSEIGILGRNNKKYNIRKKADGADEYEIRKVGDGNWTKVDYGNEGVSRLLMNLIPATNVAPQNSKQLVAKEQQKEQFDKNNWRGSKEQQQGK